MNVHASGRSQHFVVTREKDDPSPDGERKKHRHQKLLSTDPAYFVHKRYEDTALVVFQQLSKARKRASPGLYKATSSSLAVAPLHGARNRAQDVSGGGRDTDYNSHNYDSSLSTTSIRWTSTKSLPAGSSETNSAGNSFVNDNGVSSSYSLEDGLAGAGITGSFHQEEDDYASLRSDNSSVAISDAGSDFSRESAGIHSKTSDSSSQPSSVISGVGGSQQRGQTSLLRAVTDSPRMRRAANGAGVFEDGDCVSTDSTNYDVARPSQTTEYTAFTAAVSKTALSRNEGDYDSPSHSQGVLLITRL